MAKMRIGDLLIEKGYLNEEKLRIALEQQKVTGELLGDTLAKLGFVSSREMASTLSGQAGITFVDLHEYFISQDVLQLVPKNVVEDMGFIPLKMDNGTLSIGVINPYNIEAIDAAARTAGKPPKVYMVDKESFYARVEKEYYLLENPAKKRIQGIIHSIKNTGSVSAATIPQLTEMIISDGISRGATDIHITPAEETVHIFFRIDGVMHHFHCLPNVVKNGLVSRIKIMAELDIAEQRLPQDGAFAFSFLSKEYEMRVSIIPTIHGENTVIRVLGGAGTLLDITSLGFDEKDTGRLKLLFSKPYGVILIAGPTGSGKTTTLYAALREINLIEKNVLTVEDPPEYRLSMVKQTKVSLKAGYDFALAGKTFMRQDPDVMLIGEIRDEETARSAIRASITGHLVVSTIHANNAITSIPRLIDLDTDRFLLSSALLAVIAQRLVRKICAGCKVEYKVREGYLKGMGFPELEGKIKRSFRGKGCAACNNTGYLGRTLIGEIFLVNDQIRELIYAASSVNLIEKKAIESGMTTMRKSGMRKAVEGVTTFDEILRVVG